MLYFRISANCFLSRISIAKSINQAIWSLTFTDVYSGWTDNRAIWTKSSDEVLSAIANIRFKLPYQMLAFHSDNGCEFLNRNLIMYFSCDDEQKKVMFTRSRAYRKNDNCHVEQKNWTHVRDLFGYDRYDQEELVDLMNDIYKNYHNIIQNFFVPQLKLARKTRVGSKYVKEYDKPKTPYQRLLESPHLSMSEKEVLRRRYEDLNPIELQKEMNKRVAAVKKVLSCRKEKLFSLAA